MQLYSGAEGIMAAYGAVAFVVIILIFVAVIKYMQKKNK